MTGAKLSAISGFGAELRAQRAHHKWTQAELAGRIGYSASYVSDVERGTRHPELAFAEACDKVMGLPGTIQRWHAYLHRSAQPKFFAPASAVETEATAIHEWEMRSVPGLFQTKAYAKAIICGGRPRASDDTVDQVVRDRLERQAILTSASPPMMWYVLHEAVLCQVIGSPAVMREQLDRLVELSGLPGVNIQVMPFSVSDYPGSDGPILVYERSGKAPVVYTECNRGGRIVEDQDEVETLISVLHMVRAAALARRESVQLIQTVRSRYDE